MGLIDRAKNILMKPKEEWAVIEQETPDVGGIVTGYALPLILLSAICGFIGMAFIGIAGYSSISAGIMQAVTVLVGGLIGIFVTSFVVDALAPSFGSQKNFGRAVQLVVYSYTPIWIAGVFSIIPLLGFVAFIALLYTIYLIYLGLPFTMKTPEDKLVIYMVVTLVVLLVVYFIIGAILGAIYLAMGLTAGAAGMLQ